MAEILRRNPQYIITINIIGYVVEVLMFDFRMLMAFLNGCWRVAAKISFDSLPSFRKRSIISIALSVK